ncbi:MAG: two-component sensor histidine kinase [Cytophagales bacterium]|nr:MAG: two-component sensor histidine kinase [Cytophagales bacterium]
MNIRTISLFLAFLVALISTAFLSLFPEVSSWALLSNLTITFGLSYLLSFFTFEFLIFNEVNELYQALEKMKKKDFKFIKKETRATLQPLHKLNSQVYDYAAFKQQEIDELKRLEIYRREFLADVSHELKTPIFAAQGYLLTLLEGAIDDENVREKFLSKAAKSLDGLNKLVKDLLTLSKLEAGVLKMELEELDLYEIVCDVFEQLEEQAAEKNISLLFAEENYKDIYVLADYNRIHQVMMNLIENAVKYGYEGGWVSVSFTETENEYIDIAIADNGRGIPKRHSDRIFERFYRIEKSRNKERGGSGLGLAIVKQILDAHQSKIEVRSKKKQGTAFRFYLKKAFTQQNSIMPQINHSDNV